MAVPFQDGLSQFFDDSGNPLAGGLVYTYAAGTTTPVATYTTRAGTVEHTNPVELDSAGRVSIWLDRSSAYRFDVKAADGTPIDSVDNIILTDGSSPAYEVERFTATEGQTVINLAGTYTPGINAISVYVGDGGAMYLAAGTDYTETSASVITLSSALAEGETVTVIYGNSVSISAVNASEVSFQPLPAGAPARSVQAKLRDVYSIMDGGATADGVADDTAAIAFAEASSYSHVDLCGKTVYTSDLVTDLTKNYFNGTLYALNSNGFRTHVKPRSPVRGVGIDRSRQTKSTVLEWDGLNVLWLGTSIPQEAGDEGLATAYPMLFGAALGCTVSNMAWAGSHANFDYSDDPFEGSTVKGLSMTEADRLAGLAEFGVSSAYDDSFNAITLASQMTCDYRIRQQFQSTDFDVVILDHNHNDARANPGTLDPETVTVTGITKGATTTFTLSSIGTIAVGDGVGWVTSGITKLGYGSARVQTVVGNTITVDIDSTAYIGTFSSGLLSKLDRATVYGAWDFVILSIYQAALEADAATPKIILSSAPSNYTNLIANDSIYSNSQYVYDVAEKWGLAFFDVLDSLNIQEFDHLNYLADTVHPTGLGARQAIANHWVAWASGGVGRISNPDDFLARGPGTVLANQREALYSKFLDGFGTPSTILSADTLVLDEDFSAGLAAYTLVGTTVPVVVTAPWTVDNAIQCVSNSSNSSSYIQRTLTMDKGVSVEFDVWLPVVENLSPTAASKVMYLMTLREAAGLHYSVGLIVRSSGVTIRAVYFETPGADLVGVSSTKRLLANTKYRIKLEVAQETGVLLYVDGVVVAGPVVPADPTHATPTTILLGNHNGNIGGAFTSYIGNVTVNRQSVLDYSLRHTGTLYAGSSSVSVVNGLVTTATALAASNRQAVSILDYGAVGDGVTDDRAAFAAANTAGRAIYIPKPATGYTFSSSLAMTVPVSVDPSANWDQVTDGGDLSFTSNNPFQNGASPVPIYRLGGRVFVGDAADGFSGLNANNPDEAGSWYGNSTNGASYVSRDAQLLAASSTGRIAITAVSRSSDNPNAAWNATIGVAAHVVNDMSAGGGFSAGNAWGFIAELQAEPGTNVTHGIEIGAKNKKGSNANTDPYLIDAGVTGVWCAGGGDANFGGSATGPADAALVILRSGVSGLSGGGWMSGIVFTSTSIDGCDGSASSAGRGDAIRMARGHGVSWYEPTSGNAAFSITSHFNNATGAFKVVAAADEFKLTTLDEASTFAILRKGASASDYPVLQSGSTAVRLNAEGASTDIDVFLATKGAGTLRFGTWTSNADAAVNGYVTIKDAGGTTRKLATIA